MSVTFLVIPVVFGTGIAIAMVFGVFAHILRDDVGGRLDRLSYVLLRLASARLPAELRDEYYQTWAAELDAIAHMSQGRSMSRLHLTFGFTLPLLFAAHRVGRIGNPDGLQGRVGKRVAVKRYALGLSIAAGIIGFLTLAAGTGVGLNPLAIAIVSGTSMVIGGGGFLVWRFDLLTR